MFWDRFSLMCNSNATSPNAVAKKIGVSNATCTKWKNGSIPNGETLVRLSVALNCSTDYLLGQSDNPQSHTGTGEISQDENKLLACFAALNDEGKEKAIERLEEMAALDKYKKGYQPYVAKEA